MRPEEDVKGFSGVPGIGSVTERKIVEIGLG
jgi:hypothetical protein